MPSKSLYWHTFGSLANALREAGFDVPVGEERLERALEQGVELARKLKRLPKFADWADARRADESLMTEWQIYRMLEARRGAWSTFQFLVREKLAEAGTNVAPTGGCARARPTPQARRRHERPSCGARTAGSGRLLEVPVWPEALTPDLCAVADADKGALRELALSQLQPE